MSEMSEGLKMFAEALEARTHPVRYLLRKLATIVVFIAVAIAILVAQWWVAYAAVHIFDLTMVHYMQAQPLTDGIKDWTATALLVGFVIVWNLARRK